MATKAVQITYDGRQGVAKITGPGGDAYLWVPRHRAEAVATALGVKLTDDRKGGA